MRKIRIGSGAGYAGDRIEPAIELMEKSSLDYIIFECLAERTIALSQQEKMTDPEKGYNPMLEMRMRKILKLANDQRIKIITNMGAANPLAAMQKTAEIARELGLDGLKIAAVQGDDLVANIDLFADQPILELGIPLSAIRDKIISANAYLGCEGIVEALRGGADIIITGRVADPALTIGPLVYEFGWDVEHHPDQMGQAALAGHLLECAGQVTGGYYADPGRKEIPGIERLGFPFIEIDQTGQFVLSKPKGSGGLVCVDICKEQLIYEIHDPANYLTPDATADFSRVSFGQIGQECVRAERATSHSRPDTLKVSIGYKDCFAGEGEISYGGSNCLPRAKLAAEIVQKRLALIGAEISEYRVDYIGYNSLFKSAISDQLTDGKYSEIRLRISGRTKDAANAELIASEVEALYTNGPAGGAGVSQKVSEIVSICSIYVPRSVIRQTVTYAGG